jgi:hypothetical protein
METKITSKEEETSSGDKNIEWDSVYGEMETMIIKEALRKYSEEHPNKEIPNIG